MIFIFATPPMHGYTRRGCAVGLVGRCKNPVTSFESEGIKSTPAKSFSMENARVNMSLKGAKTPLRAVSLYSVFLKLICTFKWCLE